MYLVGGGGYRATKMLSYGPYGNLRSRYSWSRPIVLLGHTDTALLYYYPIKGSVTSVLEADGSSNPNYNESVYINTSSCQ